MTKKKTVSRKTAKSKKPASAKRTGRKTAATAAKKTRPASKARTRTTARSRKSTSKKSASAVKTQKRPLKKIVKKPVKKKIAVKKKPIVSKKRPPSKKTKTSPPKSVSKTITARKPKAVKKTPLAKTVTRTKHPTGKLSAIKSLTKLKDKHTPAVFKISSKRPTPVIFSLDDVREAIKVRKTEPKQTKKIVKKPTASKKQKPSKVAAIEESGKLEPRVLGAASIADVLGFNPASKRKVQEEEKKVPRKYIKYYRLLVKLRDQMRDVLELHTKDTLKRSTKEDSGDLSGYSKHTADAGTDNFDRDFALGMVSSEQEILNEIEQAIKRIFDGKYGICEVTGKPISRARLVAVPFTRFSVEGQVEFEKTSHRRSQSTGIFIDSSAEDIARFTDEDSEA